MRDDERISLTDGSSEPPDDAAASPLRPWRVLVVDDDEDVHQATRYVLRRAEILGRRLELSHTHSAQETEALLRTDRDFALILLDVVMESPQAGLGLVQFIREQCQMIECRIILRTGQPGFAPELPIITTYDINDYRTKSELTQTRLMTAVTAALRSYDQLRTIAESRRGLELIVRSAADLMERHAMLSFAEGVLTQLAALLRLPQDGIVCAHRGRTECGEDGHRFYVIGAAGRLASYISRPLEQLADIHIRDAVSHCLQTRQHWFGELDTVLYVSHGTQDAAVYLQTGRSLATLDRDLVEVFATNISAYFGNLFLIEDLTRLAFTDALTSVGNRRQCLRDVLALQGQGSVLALLELQQVSGVSLGLGHTLGDELLRAAAQRLRTGLGSEVRVTRLDGAVFGLIGPAPALEAQQLQALFTAPLHVGEQGLPLSVALGCCALDEVGDAELALRRAQLALDAAKDGAPPQGLPSRP